MRGWVVENESEVRVMRSEPTRSIKHNVVVRVER
jgi:hypothetical protein